MSRKNSSTRDDSELENAVAQIETRLQGQPNNRRLISGLLTLLDCQSPQITGSGPYSKCQRALSDHFHAAGLSRTELTSTIFLDSYCEWQSVLDAHDINTDVAIAQLFEGTTIQINGTPADCGRYLNMFKEKEVISNLCFDCFKVQILPDSLISLIGLYFTLRSLKLERDNSRKCMVEAREAVKYPYKGYIFCQSEEEALDCLQRLKAELLRNGLPNMYCGLSHGCSEYGLKYPDFKYSSEGNHRLFKKPNSWGEQEDAYLGSNPSNRQRILYHGNHEITVRDMIGFETWIKYAEIIGDDTYKQFVNDKLVNKKFTTFTERVAKQAQIRKAQLIELQQRQQV